MCIVQNKKNKYFSVFLIYFFLRHAWEGFFKTRPITEIYVILLNITLDSLKNLVSFPLY